MRIQVLSYLWCLCAPLMGFQLDEPSSYNHSSLVVNDHRYHFVTEGPANGSLVVLCHGFPESWYMFKHQINLLSGLGYRTVAVDMLGYGETDVPSNLKNYTYESITSDLNELVHSLGYKKAIFLGHDWGSPFVWQMGLTYPETVDGIISICVPFYGPVTAEPADILKAFPNLSYQFSLAVSDSTKMDRKLDTVLRAFYSSDEETLYRISTVAPFGQITDSLEELNLKPDVILTNEELNYLKSQFRDSKLLGPTNYYRTMAENTPFLLNSLKNDNKINSPALFIKANKDLVNEFGNDNEKYTTDVTERYVNGGHWIQLTHHRNVNRHIVNWLKTHPTVPKTTIVNRSDKEELKRYL